MSSLQPGDLVAHKQAPYTVKVDAVTTCDDDGCELDIIVFKDPETGEEDAAHARDFRRA
jgi:hypothetical protein